MDPGRTGGGDLDIRVLTHPHQRAAVRSLAHALVHELQAMHVPATLAADGYPDDADDRSVFVVICPEVLHGLTGTDIAGRSDLFARTIVVLADDSALLAPDEAMSWYGAAGGVLATDPGVVARLVEHGVDARRLLPGRTTAWAADGPGRQVDVVSVGSASPDRGRVLARCADVLSRVETALWFEDGPHAPPDPTSPLRGARVGLLVHDDGGRDRFDWLGAWIAMHAGAVVLTQRAGGVAPLVAGEQFVSGSEGSLPDVLAALLEDDGVRERVAAAATAWLDAHPLSDGAAQLVEVASALTGRRAPWSGMHLPTRPRGRDQPRALTDSEDASVVRRVLREVRLDLMELRRAQDRAEARSGGGAGEDTTELWSSQGDSRPRVSVLTAVYQHAHHVTEALESVAGSRFRDLEVVVVDDGSRDGSSEAVLAFARAHPEVPVRLLRHGVNRGLGAARNTALEHARGELVFVLDADNTVRVDGIGRLVAALDADPGAAMAYGVLDSFDVHGPAGVLNAYEWDAERFRTGNYIDAMALSRAHRVRDLGGFTTDRRLYGWEDFDLWCGFAGRGWRGVRVPTFVARYRSSPTSMVSISDYSHHAPYAALVERHPELMRGIVPPL